MLRPRPFLALILALCSSPAALAAGEEGLSGAERATVAALRALRAEPDSTDVQLAALELSLKDSLELTAAVLQARVIPPLEEDEMRQTLSEPQRALLLAGLANVEVMRVRGAVERSFGNGEVQAGLWMLSVVGTGPDSEKLFETLDEVRRAGAWDAESAEALRYATGAILRRDASGFVWLESVAPRVHSTFLPPLLSGLGDARDARGLGVLSALLSRRPECYELAVPQIRRVGRGLDAEVNAQVARLALARMHTAGPGLVQEALRAAGALRASGGVEKLLELLEDDHASTREAAHWALQALSGKQLGPESDAWRAWHMREIEHLASTRPQCELDLNSSNPGRQAAAIKEIGRRELFREEWGALLVDFRAPSPELDALRCRALGQLGAVGAVDCLLGRTRDELVLVRGAAGEALVAITGLSAPEDPRDWTERLGR